MAEVILQYPNGDNVRNLNISDERRFLLQQIIIHAETMEGLRRALDQMSIYILFTFNNHNHQYQTRRFPLREINIPNDGLPIIGIMNQEIAYPNATTQIRISIIEDVFEPVTQIDLFIEDFT